MSRFSRIYGYIRPLHFPKSFISVDFFHQDTPTDQLAYTQTFYTTSRVSGRKTAVRKTAYGRAGKEAKPSPPPAAGPQEVKEVAVPELVPESHEPVLETRQFPGDSNPSPSSSLSVSRSRRRMPRLTPISLMSKKGTWFCG